MSNPVLKKPIEIVGAADTPALVPIDISVGRKACIHCRTNSPVSGLVYLTSGEDPDASAYTIEVQPGGLYEIPLQHSGEVWTAGLAGAALMTVTQYG